MPFREKGMEAIHTGGRVDGGRFYDKAVPCRAEWLPELRDAFGVNTHPLTLVLTGVCVCVCARESASETFLYLCTCVCMCE